MVYSYLLGELVLPEVFPCLDQDALFHVPPLYGQEGDEVVHETLLDHVGVMETPVFAECALRNQSFQVPESWTKLNFMRQYNVDAKDFRYDILKLVQYSLNSVSVSSQQNL